MESNGKFTLIVFNTCTREYEEVMVTEENTAKAMGSVTLIALTAEPGGISRTMIRVFLTMRSR